MMKNEIYEEEPYKKEYFDSCVMCCINGREYEELNLWIDHGNRKDHILHILHYASQTGNTSLCKFCIDAGGDVNTKLGNMNALERAQTFKKADIVKYLSEIVSKGIVSLSCDHSKTSKSEIPGLYADIERIHCEICGKLLEETIYPERDSSDAIRKVF